MNVADGWQMQELSPGETLSSLQAMVIYTIMRLMDSGVSYFLVNGGMLKTNRVRYLHNARAPTTALTVRRNWPADSPSSAPARSAPRTLD